MSLSLDGVRVLELARYQAGPRGGMILSDLGAEVIKIERIGGEETRKHAPMVRGQSIYFTVYNRGKKSICLDLRTPRGKEIFADTGEDRRHRAGEFPARHDEGHGLRVRAAASAEPRHHPGLGFRLRPVRSLHRSAGVRSARPGDERPDVADRQAGRPAARHRFVGGRSLYRAARDDRRAGRAAASRPHRRGAAGRRLPARFRADHGGDPHIGTISPPARKAARAAARRIAPRTATW